MFKSKILVVITLSLLVIFTLVSVEGSAESEYTFRTGTMQPEGHPYNIALNWMAEEAAERSNGKVNIELFIAGQLGSELEMLQNAMLGKEVDFLNVSTGNIAPLVPEMDFFTLPFLFNGYPEFEEAMFGNEEETFGEIGNIIKDLLAKRDLILIGMFTSGDRNLLLRNEKIMHPDDLEGFKMRVFESPINKRTWDVLGADTVVVDFGELYTALQTGVADGAEQDFTATYTNKFYEPIEYIGLTHHLFMPNPLVVPRAKWESWPKEIQDLMKELGKETSQKFMKEQKKAEKEYAEIFKEEGVEIYEVNREPFIEAAQPLVQDFAKKNGLTWLLEEVKKYQ